MVAALAFPGGRPAGPPFAFCLPNPTAMQQPTLPTLPWPALSRHLVQARDTAALLITLCTELFPHFSLAGARLTRLYEEDHVLQQAMYQPPDPGAHAPAVEQHSVYATAAQWARYRDGEAGWYPWSEALLVANPGAGTESAGQTDAEGFFCPLYSGGERIGVLELLPAPGEAPGEELAWVLAALAPHLGALLGAITTREELVEKKAMLALGEDIATIRDQDDLYRLMLERLRPLVGYDDAVVVTIKDGQYNNLFTMATADRQAHPLFQRIVKVDLPIEGSPFEFLQAQAPIYHWALKDMLARYPTHPGLLLMRETGLSHSVTVQLRHGGALQGLLFFHYNQAPVLDALRYKRYRTVADLLAVALSNVLANQEVAAREAEKATLLSISESLSAIRDKHDLFKVVFAQLKPLFGFDDAALVLRDTNRQEVTYWHTGPVPGPDGSGNHPVSLQKLGMTDDTAYPGLDGAEGPQLLTHAQLVKRYPAYQKATQHLRRGQWASHVFMPLRYGSRLLGVFEFHSRQADRFRPQALPLYRNLAEQLAVTVSNILANETLAASEREKTLQLTLTNLLTEPLDWEQKLLEAVRVLQAFVPFDYAVAGLERKQETGGGYSYYRTGFDEYQVLKVEDFLRMTRLTPGKLTQLRAAFQYDVPLLLNGEAFEIYCRQHPLKGIIASTFRLGSNLMFPFPLSRDGVFMFSFYSKKADTYGPEHLELLHRLRHALALTLDKILAYEEIEKLTVQLRQEKTYLMEEMKTKYNYEEIIGTSPLLQGVFRAVSRVAPTDTTVLIGGETGTGKELIARAIHNQSPRRERPLIKVNCAALPANLIESELFGHEKGAFTGAHDRRIGKFELAHGGTIFLDEIGELPLELQAKLLRVLQEKEVERIGSKTTIKVDFRVIAATNRDLEQEVLAGRFRSDLYYRLHIFPILLPPLRERREDVPLLATYFAQKFCRKLGKPFLGIAPATLSEMLAYPWPGNIRELENIMEQAVILSEHAVEWQRPVARRAVGAPVPGPATPPLGDAAAPVTVPAVPPPAAAYPALPAVDIKSQREQWEKEKIMQALLNSQGRIRGATGAATLLGVKPTTLEAKMKKLGIFKKYTA
jgi:transcriptional regulator with GAF, ATPase, and Fis domain